MATTINISEGCPTVPPAPPAPTPGPCLVRAWYQGAFDAGHTYGPFLTVEAAEACALALAGRADVRAVAITPVP